MLLKKNYKISFDLRLLSKVVCLGHVGDIMTNAAVLNNDFTIFLNSISFVMDNDFIIFQKFKCRYPE